MKNSRSNPLDTLLATALCLTLALDATAREKTIALKDAPAAIQKAINDQLKGGKLKTLSVETEDGKTEYEAEMMVDGQDRTLVMDVSGRVLETEVVVELANLPDAVKTGLAHEAGRGTIARVEASTKAGVTYYEALVKEAGRKDREVAVGPDGKPVHDKK
jgi:uncharacterized membrane protein YkoI